MHPRPILVAMHLLLVLGCRRSTFNSSPINARTIPHIQSDDRMSAVRSCTFPNLLSQVGAFDDLATLKPAAGVQPYEINVSFWSDGAEKQRWIALPSGGKIQFSPDGEWRFPAGTIFVKHFALPERHRLETRVLVCDGLGGVSGAAYKWRADGTDADIVTDPISENITVTHREARQKWHFPGRADCVICHTTVAGGVLGVKTRQMNRAAKGTETNQLVQWDQLAMFTNPLAQRPKCLPKLAAAEDRSKSVEDRARSYLDANCAQCHRPGGVAGNFDARYDTPLSKQNLIDGPVLIDFGIDRARVVAPRDPWRSILLNRVETSDQTKMPPLAHDVLDRHGAQILREWIASLPGTPVLEPPTIEPKGGEFSKRARVVLRHPAEGATIRYTLDGSLPGKSSPIYNGPFEITEPATLRVRAYKDGMTRSIAIQETFIVTP